MTTEVKRYGYTVPVPREVLLDLGAVEPTPAERREADRREAEADMEQRAAATADARRRLAAITDQPARAVLDLHAENERGECEGDDMEGYECEWPGWPCRTVETIARHYGINPEDL